MNSLIKNKGFLIMAMLFMFISGCKKESKITPSKLDNFLHTYPEKQNQKLAYAHPTNDGGFLLICSYDHEIPGYFKIFTLIKTDASGKIQWKNTLNDTIFEPHVTLLNDGSLMVGSSNYFGYLMKISPEGNIVFKNNYYYGGGFYMSNPIKGDNGNYFIGLTNGPFQGGPSTNVIETFDPAGTELKYYIISDDDMGGKIQTFKIYRQSDPDIYYVYGSLLLGAWKWSDNPRFFVARLEIKNDVVTDKKIKILDKDNILFRNNVTAGFSRHLKTIDNSLIFTTFQRDYNEIDLGYICKIDPDLNQVWDLRFKIGNNGTRPNSISICNDGSYLISGSCINRGSPIQQPFACRISSGGEILWQKIYSMPMASRFNSGSQLPDDSYIFGGETISFGEGKDLEDMILIKTDKDGNIK